MTQVYRASLVKHFHVLVFMFNGPQVSNSWFLAKSTNIPGTCGLVTNTNPPLSDFLSPNLWQYLAMEVEMTSYIIMMSSGELGDSWACQLSNQVLPWALCQATYCVIWDSAKKAKVISWLAWTSCKVQDKLKCFSTAKCSVLESFTCFLSLYTSVNTTL